MLTKSKPKPRSGRRFAMAAAAVALAASSMVAVAGAANAGTVYNRLYCDINTGLCYQVNGTHNPTVKNQCFWQYGGTSGYPNYFTVNDCAGPKNAGWGTPIWQHAIW